MHEIAAVVAALDMSHNPSSVRLAQRAALPKGTPFLLEIAAGDSNAIAYASAQTGRSEERLREAAGFFIEQVLLHPECDSYRVLGGGSDMPTNELRRHMALLLKWLHPDVAAHVAGHEMLDRSVFANRVTQAWEDLKTTDRRATYDRTIEAKRVARPETNRLNTVNRVVVRQPGQRSARPPVPQPRPPKPSTPKREDLVTRFVRLLLGDRR
jgi:hypothetical protein